MILTGHDDRRLVLTTPRATDGSLEHCLSALKRKQLLGMQRPRQRPETRPGAAAEDDRTDAHVRRGPVADRNNAAHNSPAVKRVKPLLRKFRMAGTFRGPSAP